jgi:hypothetical protein
MISAKFLSTAVLAVMLPFAMPTASFAGGHGGGHGGGMHMGGGMRMGGGGMHMGGGPRNFAGNGGWHGGDHDSFGRGGRGFFPGAVAGALIGGAIASDSYAYYGGPNYYYGPGYNDNTYYDNGYDNGGYYGDGTVAVVPGSGDDVAYCQQRYRSYDPASGTYLGYDGQRHPCP